jgi:hypothetical protein
MSSSGFNSQELWDNVVTFIFFVISAIGLYTFIFKIDCIDPYSEIPDYSEHLGDKFKFQRIKTIFGMFLIIIILIFRLVISIWNHIKFVQNGGKPPVIIGINIANIVMLNLCSFIIAFILCVSLTIWNNLWSIFYVLNDRIKILEHPMELKILQKMKTIYNRTTNSTRKWDDTTKIFTAGFLFLLFSGIIITVRRIGIEIISDEKSFAYIGMSVAYCILLFVTLLYTMSFAASINSESISTLKHLKISAARATIEDRSIDLEREVRNISIGRS